jgi:hypothetical protein
MMPSDPGGYKKIKSKKNPKDKTELGGGLGRSLLFLLKTITYGQTFTPNTPLKYIRYFLPRPHLFRATT